MPTPVRRRADPNLPGLDPAKLRTAFVVYGGGAHPDWRTVCANPHRRFEAPDLGRQLRPALNQTDAQRTRPLSADAYLAELEAKAAPARRMVLPLTPSERAFLDVLLDQGQVEPQLLTAGKLYRTGSPQSHGCDGRPSKSADTKPPGPGQRRPPPAAQPTPTTPASHLRSVSTSAATR